MKRHFRMLFQKVKNRSAPQLPDMSVDLKKARGESSDLKPTNDPLPACTPHPAENAGSQPTASTAQSDSDPYASLKDFDTVFVVDDSGSMASGTLWSETQEALAAIAEICPKYDEDGIDVYFLNHPDSDFYKNITLPSTVSEIFQNVQPRGATPTGKCLGNILEPYLERYEKDNNIKPMNIIVLTDGDPTDNVKSVIIKTVEKLEKLEAPPWQVGIQFVQIGHNPTAMRDLQELDNELVKLADEKKKEKKGKNIYLRDIVDTVTFKGSKGEPLTANGRVKVVLGAVSRKLDRNDKDLHH